MHVYQVTVDLYICADSTSEAADVVQAELDYLAQLDNQISAWDYTPDVGVVKAQDIL
jgi:hypothetical protein